MRRTYILIVLVSAFSWSLISCDDFLDKNPDDRTELNTKAKIRDVLVSAYPNASYSIMAELSSDNFIDNNNYIKPSPKLNAFRRFHEEIFAWEPAVSGTTQDSPTAFWGTTYKAIATANHALEAIEKMESEGTTADLSPQKGEALLCRAFGHFLLVNLFSKTYKDEELSELDPGIPYSVKPETEVDVKYPRGTVAEVYRKIEADIEAGFPLISDREYQVPQYHFNRKAAAAFAARFYLYKRNYDKVVEYANIVLGDNPGKNSFRDWSKDYSGPRLLGYDYINSVHTCNLLLIPVYSNFIDVFGSRYGNNGDDALKGGLYGTGPTWSGSKYPPSMEGKLFVIGSQDYGLYLPKYYPMFEYTDRVAGTGFAREVRVEFTPEETLLCRAEAYVYLNQTANAVKDLQLWNEVRLSNEVLTESVIKSFYTAAKPLFVKQFNTEKLSPRFVVTKEQKPFIDCVLHFRRIETVLDGLRWFDLKRYGIEIEHAIGEENRVIKLTYDDPRRALQLPASVIAAGLEPNVYSNPEAKMTKLIMNNDDE